MSRATKAHSLCRLSAGAAERPSQIIIGWPLNKTGVRIQVLNTHLNVVTYLALIWIREFAHTRVAIRINQQLIRHKGHEVSREKDNDYQFCGVLRLPGKVSPNLVTQPTTAVRDQLKIHGAHHDNR